ncbi:MAG: type II CAAX endopeptidase family protein [Bacteroidota bacterium]
MDVFHWSPEAKAPVLVLALLCLGYSAYWFVGHSAPLRRWVTQRHGDDRAEVYLPLYQKHLGVLLLGFVPLGTVLLVLPYDLLDYGLGRSNPMLFTYWILALCALVIPLGILSGRKPTTQTVYPQVRAREWDLSLIVFNALTWAAYLFAYELLFRGILLAVCVPVMGVWPAIAINVVLYALAHLPKGPLETFGALPFGVVLCMSTLLTGTIWVAFVSHVALAWANDYAALRYHPEMRVLVRRRADV